MAPQANPSSGVLEPQGSGSGGVINPYQAGGRPGPLRPQAVLANFRKEALAPPVRDGTVPRQALRLPPTGLLGLGVLFSLSLPVP